MSKFHASVSLHGVTVSGTIKDSEEGSLAFYQSFLTQPNLNGVTIEFTDGRLVWAPSSSLIQIKEIPHG